LKCEELGVKPNGMFYTIEKKQVGTGIGGSLEK
jgi:hypothetical protein